MTHINTGRTKIGIVILAYIAFISLGLPDGLLGVAWPSVRKSFSCSLDALGLLLAASTAGYLISSFCSGSLISKWGVGWVLSASCAATGIGLIGYTLAPVWPVMICLAVVAGLGAGAIDAGINTYAASHFSEKLMQWLHASWGIGITMGPVIMTTGINYFSSWRLGYIIVGIAQIVLALCFAATESWWKNGSSKKLEQTSPSITDYKTSMPVTLRQSAVWISMLMFFVYAGIEASLGNWTYTFLTESRGISTELAGFWVGSYWATFTIGRILAGVITRHFSLKSLISLSLVTAFTGGILLMWNPFSGSDLLGIVVMGFAIAPIFPGMVSLTESRVGSRFTTNTIGLQFGAAGLGLALIPGLTGVLAKNTSLEVIPALVITWIVLLFVFHTLSIRIKPLKEHHT